MHRRMRRRGEGGKATRNGLRDVKEGGGEETEEKRRGRWRGDGEKEEEIGAEEA